MERNFYCDICDELMDPPEYCCNGYMCGCMGQPTSPPVCSPECWEFFMYSITQKSHVLIKSSI